MKLITTLCLIILTQFIHAQTISEDQQILQYVAKYHPNAQPEMSGLYIIKQIKTPYPKVIPGKQVTVHYEGKFLDNKVFDSSYSRNHPIQFVLGQGSVIAGWEQGIATMRQGEKAILIIPSYLAYGNKKSGQIPPNTPLVFTVEIIKPSN